MARKNLRVVEKDERPEPPEPVDPPTLLEAVKSGDVLDMLLAQRRLIAESLTSAPENTKPQFNNELNKLHVLIAAEESRLRAARAEENRESGDSSDADEAFDSSAV